jgi:hypothetical protein
MEGADVGDAMPSRFVDYTYNDYEVIETDGKSIAGTRISRGNTC